MVLDGLFSEQSDGTVRFDEATNLSSDDAHDLQWLLQRRILRLFQRRGLLEPATVENMLTWQGSGGFSLDASVRIHGTDRTGRERLLRYCARPPFALERMSLEHGSRNRTTGGGPEAGNAGPEEAGPAEAGPIRRVLYFPARPLPDGRSVLALSPLELPSATSATLRFLAALARIYEVSPLQGPGCGAEMRILAFITDPAPIVAILRHLDLSTRPPARGPPQPDLPLEGEPPLDLDQTPAFDPAEPEPLPDADFDESWGA